MCCACVRSLCNLPLCMIELAVCVCLLLQFLNVHDQLTAAQATKLWNQHVVSCGKQVGAMKKKLEIWGIELGE